jgi:SAM-dependent methyltransferase
MTSRFVATQRAHYRDANARHYAWQTGAPWFAATEARLVAGVRARPGERVLEIGCGEGGNLHHVGESAPGARLYGVDFSPAKAEFAHQATGAHTAAADAARLPFAGGSFDAVLIRDLLHHLPDRTAALREAYRVLKPNGRLTLVEPNRRSPLVMLQAALVPAERGLFRSTQERLRRELDESGFDLLAADERQPLPVARVVLHPRLGADQLGGIFPIARALDALDALAGRVVPRKAWTYLVFQGVRR